jgi:hypothetical protein
MTIFLIIIGILGALIGIFLVSNKIGVDRLIRENKEVCDAHKKLGYPKLEKNIQYKILETGDLSPIGELIPELSSKRTPMSLLKHYIKVSREDFAEYLDSSGFIEKHTISDDPDTWLQDGVWIKDYGDHKIIVSQERGNTFKTWDFKTKNQAAKIYSDLLWYK